MPAKFVDRFKTGFMPILESVEGDYLLCGRTVSDGAVFDKFSDALACMNAEIEDNRHAFRKVKVAKVVEFDGMVSCVALPDNDQKPTSGHA